MAIPEMPSFLRAYYYADQEEPTFYGSFYGRVVPTPYVGNKVVSVSAFANTTHWVDCETWNNIPYGLGQPSGVVGSLPLDWDASRAGVIIYCRPDSEPWILLVLWAEIRYADTDKEYRRYWCQRVREDNILFEHPC